MRFHCWTLLFIASTLTPVISFNVLSQQVTRRRGSECTTFYDKSTTIEYNTSIDQINVCMGELCKCQEEGNNAESILNDLRARNNLPFEVDEAPCLGACGVGSMVSIEYESGDYDLVTGLDETLQIIGVHLAESSKETEVEEKENRLEVWNESNTDTGKDSITPNNDEEKVEIQALVQNVNLNGKANEEANRKNQSPLMSTTKENEKSIQIENRTNIEDQHDAIKRMRAEATENEEQTNPWLKMAMYIGKKIINK